MCLCCTSMRSRRAEHPEDHRVTHQGPELTLLGDRQCEGLLWRRGHDVELDLSPGAGGQSPLRSISPASTSYSSPAATSGAADTTRPTPASGAIASSTSVISSSLAPATSARPTLQSTQAADNSRATDTATCNSATVLASSADASGSPSPNPALTNFSSKIASLRRVS